MAGATPVPHPKGLNSSRLGEEGVDQSRLAYAGFPGDDPHLSLALECRGEPLVHLGQFALAPDKEYGCQPCRFCVDRAPGILHTSAASPDDRYDFADPT